MDWTTLLLLSGLLYGGTNALTCYMCNDCADDNKQTIECSTNNHVACSLVKDILTGKVYKSCVQEAPGDALYDISSGCIAQGNTVICKCSTDNCNTIDLIPSVANALQTTTPAETSAQEERRLCYKCGECGADTGVLVDCTLYSSSKSCYFSRDPSGVAYRTCGSPELDEIVHEPGCYFAGGYIVCKCEESGCNEYPQFAQAVTACPHNATTTSTPTTTTTSTSTPATNEIIFTPPMSGIKIPETWFCYACSDCGDSIGVLEDCSLFSSSKSCLLMISPTGEVSRGCGLRLFDEELSVPNGCRTTQGTTICKCSENSCNDYPEFIALAQDETTNSEVTTTTASTFYCYICVDCGTSLGASYHCSGVSSCSLVVEEGTVRRSCGSPAIDLIIPERNGCKENEEGTIVCKCSTEKCNVFPSMTGLNPSAKASREPPIPVKTFWALVKPVTFSGGANMAVSWLILLIHLALATFLV